MKIYDHIKSCTLMLRVVLTVVTKWKHHKHPSTAKMDKQKWPVHTMEYYSATKGMRYRYML